MVKLPIPTLTHDRHIEIGLVTTRISLRIFCNECWNKTCSYVVICNEGVHLMSEMNRGVRFDYLDVGL